ncbi:MAG: putative integral membrane protein [Clostridium sp.]|jgi:uncharacterized integral membrane protein
MRIGFIISLIFAILVALFGIQNSAVISVNFFSVNFNISLALIIFVSAIIGAIVVTLLGLQKEFSLRRANKRLTKNADNFKSEIEICKDENVALKVENETFKTKIETLDTKVEDLETNTKAFIEEINVLNMEIGRLNGISTNETIILK